VNFQKQFCYVVQYFFILAVKKVNLQILKLTMLRKTLISILAILAGVFLLHSCSTEKNTSVSRLYHNTTAHFNIYFNGFESFKKGMISVKESPDDYTQLLRIYKNENEEVKNSISADMDQSIIKAIKMIKMHSITAKPKRKKSKSGKRAYELTEKQKEFYAKNEYCKWVDDAYLLIGKAHYYKGDYQGAFRSLHLILNKFRKEEIRFDAMYWIARSNAALGDFNEADNYLKLIINDPEKPERLNYAIDLCYADLFMKQKKYNEAIEKLDYIISKTKKKKDKARFVYIQAQLYQELNKGDESMELFAKVLKMNPSYDMAFNAKINMAKSFITGSEGSDQIRKLLDKLLKDDKNIEFQDQIYYVLAGVEMKEGNEDQALEYYHKSVQKSVSNENQKALSYLALADIYFKKRKYLPAGEYYDSTMNFLDKKYPDYIKISAKAKNLKELTDNLKLIMHEDSIQKVAAMDSLKRLQYIEGIIDRLIASEREELNKGFTQYDQFNRGDYDPNKSKGNWYFYNEQAKSIGKAEFQKVWGKRKLEDHWRRKNKQVITEFGDEESNEENSGRITDNKKVEYYLQDLPLTDSLITISNEKIAKAYFDAGVIYERKMFDYDEAVKSYENLIKRFPDHRLNVEAYFNMYLIWFDKKKNNSLAEKNRNSILSKYPNSKYAKILSDPNYLNTLKENKDKIDELYADAYQAYKKSKYDLVLEKTEKAFSISEQNHLEAKFYYLQGMSKGSIGKYDEMKQVLEKIVNSYPNDEITPVAQDALDLLKSGKYDPDYYSFEKDSVYYFAISVHFNDSVTANELKYVLTTFNVIEFPKVKMQTEISNLKKRNKIVLVKSFADDISTMNYYSKLQLNEKFISLNKEKYSAFIISKTNFNKLKKLPIVEKYFKSFKNHYNL
jgi:tetratricopeptide (TPR) repeat protein